MLDKGQVNLTTAIPYNQCKICVQCSYEPWIRPCNIRIWYMVIFFIQKLPILIYAFFMICSPKLNERAFSTTLSSLKCHNYGISLSSVSWWELWEFTDLLLTVLWYSDLSQISSSSLLGPSWIFTFCQSL